MDKTVARGLVRTVPERRTLDGNFLHLHLQESVTLGTRRWLAFLYVGMRRAEVDVLRATGDIGDEVLAAFRALSWIDAQYLRMPETPLLNAIQFRIGLGLTVRRLILRYWRWIPLDGRWSARCVAAGLSRSRRASVYQETCAAQRERRKQMPVDHPTSVSPSAAVRWR